MKYTSVLCNVIPPAISTGALLLAPYEAACKRHGKVPFLITHIGYSPEAARSHMTSLVHAETQDYQPDEEVKTVLKNPNDKYKAMSVLQKAIRRNNPHMAKRAAHALLTSGGGVNCWRRIAVISLEDVGLAAPYKVACALVLAQSAKLRASLGEKKVLFWAIDQLCAAAKSRDLCDIVVHFYHNPDSKPRYDEMMSYELKEPQLAVFAHGQDFSFETRLMAFWLLRGAKWNPWDKAKVLYNDRGLSEQVMDKLQTPGLIRYLVDEGDKAAHEALHLPIPILWQFMMQSLTFTADEDFFTGAEDAIIQGSYGAAFDKHTYIGKAAINRFAKHKPIADWFAAHPTADISACMERAVFYTEGSVLKPRLNYVGANALYTKILDAKMRANGLPDLVTGMELYRLIEQELPVLNKIRYSMVAK